MVARSYISSKGVYEMKHGLLLLIGEIRLYIFARIISCVKETRFTVNGTEFFKPLFTSPRV